MLLLSVIAVTTITTTIQIQPAYSQAQHCTNAPRDISICVTLGQDPSITVCGLGGDCRSSPPLSHQDLGQFIARGHLACAQGLAECTVTRP